MGSVPINSVMGTDPIYFKNTNRGQTIIFEDIIARSPDGADRTLSPLIISIN